MLRSVKELQDYTIQALDGEIGKVHEFYFDDAFWTIRYLVVDTGGWLSGRRVLLSPVSLRQPDWEAQCFPVQLTKEQVEGSPPITTDQPVSIQHSQLDALHHYYGWPSFWSGRLIAHPLVKPPNFQEEEREKGDPHLRSSREVVGYHIQATDGEIGHVEDFIVHDVGWVIHYMIVDTRNWLPGKKVLIGVDWLDQIRWAERKVQVALGQSKIEKSPEFDPSQPVTRTYEQRLYDYYGRPVYWSER